MTYSPNFFGSSATGSVRSVQSGYQNGSLSTISKGSPVSVNALGKVVLTDVSDESSANTIVGLMSVDTPSAATGTVIDSGRLEDVTTSFLPGDAIYIDKSGGITNVKPSIGVNGFVAGDFVIFLGVVVVNEFDGLKKDFKLMISIVGQL